MLRRSRARARGDPTTVRQAVVRFALIGVLCLAGVGIGTYVVSDTLAEREALRDASTRARGLARGIVAPLLTEDVRAGEASGLEPLDTVLQGRIAEGGVSHIVLWDQEGTILWSSDGRHLGETYPLSRGGRDALASQRVVAHLPDSASEHAMGFLVEEGQLEVYVGAVGADGLPFLLEVFLPADRIEEDRAAVLPKLLGVSLGAVLLLLAMIIPLAVQLAQRVDDARRAQTESWSRSIEAWRHQRRLLAQDLHDGIIQDMAAIGLALSLLEGRRIDGAASADVLARLQDSARHAEAALRSLVLDLTPRVLGQTGLPDAVVDLVRQHSRHGLDVTLSYDRDVQVSESTGILAFQVVREGLRNVVKHADATSVLVAVRRGHAPATVEIEITDDGAAGLLPSAMESGQGLRLLRDTIVDAGGSLHLEPATDGGAGLVATIPIVGALPVRL